MRCAWNFIDPNGTIVHCDNPPMFITDARFQYDPCKVGCREHIGWIMESMQSAHIGVNRIVGGKIVGYLA